MNEVGASESGTGLRAIKSSRSSDANFESYDDSEWDVGIGNLIIDLDADIEKNNEANRNNNNSSSVNIGTPAGNLSSSNTGSSNQVATGATTVAGGGGSMHIPLTTSNTSNSGKKSSSNNPTGSSGNGTSSGKGSNLNDSSSTNSGNTTMEHSAVVDKGLKMKIKRTKTGAKSDAKHEIVKNDVIGSSNGTGSSTCAGNHSSNSKSSLDSSTSSKNSHKDKDKLKDNQHNLHDNTHNDSSINNVGGKGSAGDNSVELSIPTTPSGKAKTPKKGSTKEKKVKNSGNSGNNKKDEKNNEGGGKGSLSNSGGASGKEYMSTTVNLNVPTVIPNSNSSAFVKATATIKVPTAPGSSILASSGNGGNNLHNVHSSSGGDSSSSNNRNNNGSTVNSNSNWGTASPSKGDKGRLSPNQSNSSEKGSSYKKARASAAAAPDKAGSNQDENSTGSHNSSSSSSASYRNQALISTATDLSSSSSTFVQGTTGSQPGNGGSGFSSPKDTSKGGRSNTASGSATASSSTESSTVQRSVQCSLDTSVGTITEIDYLGPCEPGTPLVLEGIVWHETESGVLAVNMTWRGKSYVGALIDATKSDWAPPRFCDSPTSDLEMRTPKNRGKRGRAQAATPVNEPSPADTRSANAKLRNGAKGRRGSNTAAAFVAPASPVKPDPWPKRKTRGSENEGSEDPNPKNAKRPKVSRNADRNERRSNSPATDNKKSGSTSLIICPEPNCSKEYKNHTGLKYHLKHAHTNLVSAEDSDSNMSTASTTNTSSAVDPSGSNSAENTVEPMAVDEIEGDASEPGSVAGDDSPAEPSTPGKKSTGILSSSSAASNSTSASTKASLVDDKIYDLSSDADLNLGKDSNSSGYDGPEPYKSGKSSSASNSTKSQAQSKDSSTADTDSKLVPENLSKDSSSSATPSSNSVTPTLTPRAPILTVPVVPYMSSLQNRNMAHGHIVNVPRIESSLNSSRDSENTSPMKNAPGSGQSTQQKVTPWQPHAAQSGIVGHSPHSMMNTSPPATSITVPLNIPMNIPEKLGGGSLKDRDKNSSSSELPSKKNKHKKKSKDKDKDRDGKSKDKDRENSLGKGINIPMPPGSGPSDYSRSSGHYHNAMGGESVRSSKDSISSSGEDNDSSRKNSVDNREDPQSPAYSDISDANDSGPDGELSVGAGMKDGNCKGLVIPTAEIKKDPLNVPGGVPGGPPFHQSYFNHNLHSPYLDSLSYAAAARQAKESPDGRVLPPVGSGGSATEDPEKNRPAGPIKHPGLPSNPPGAPGGPIPGGSEEGRRSPKMDFHSKYPYSNYFPHPGHPYPNFLYPEHSPYHNPVENSFGAPGQGRLFPGMEEREKEGTPNSGKTSGKPGDKDEGLGNVQIKQEPHEREERSSSRGKEKHLQQTSAFAMNIDQDKNIEIKSEFGGSVDHVEPKLVPPYMSNSSSKHLSSKEHSKRSSEDGRHDRDRERDRRHGEGKELDAKSDSMKSSRNSYSDKGKSSSSVEEPSEKERKDEGAKPTMETTGPPPPPTASAYYLPQGYLGGNPFALPFDPSHPLYRQMLVPGPYQPSPYLHPGQIPRFPSPGGPTPLPEDLSRPSPPGGPPGNSAKALDLLQHHAAQYYNSHKIHELQERALKSPSPQVANQRGLENRDGPVGPGGPGGVGLPPSSSPGHSLSGGLSVGGRGGVGGSSVSASSAMPKPADLSKEAKPTIGPGGSILPGISSSDNVRTPPPTQHHVHSHTHHHTHVGIGYPMPPIIPAVSPQYSPHYGVLASPASAASSVIPPFPPPKPS